MKRRRFLTLVPSLSAVMLGASCKSTRTPSALAAPAGFTGDPAALARLKAPAGSKQWDAARPLFAADLSDAECKPGAWTWKDGVLASRKGAGMIWTKADYGNFYLCLEFRCSAKTDSGLFFRCSDTKDYVQNSLEVQILQGDHPSGNERALAGALYDCAAPSRQVEIEPGQWYKLLLAAEDERVTVYVDDERLVRANLAKWTAARQNPDGTPNKFKKPLKDFARSGRVGLQGNAPVEFRNLYIDPA